MFLVTDPMNVISRNNLGGMCFFAFDSHEKSIAIISIPTDRPTTELAQPPALGMGVPSSAAGPRHGGSLLCRRPSATGFPPLPPALGHGLVFKFSSFLVFKFSSFRFFKFSNCHKCSPPSLPPFPPPTTEILAETKLECKTLG